MFVQVVLIVSSSVLFRRNNHDNTVQFSLLHENKVIIKLKDLNNVLLITTIMGSPMLTFQNNTNDYDYVSWHKQTCLHLRPTKIIWQQFAFQILTMIIDPVCVFERSAGG